MDSVSKKTPDSMSKNPMDITRLGSLLCQAYRHGLHEKIRDSIHTGALKAYENAIGEGEEHSEDAASDAQNVPARRAAG